MIRRLCLADAVPKVPCSALVEAGVLRTLMRGEWEERPACAFPGDEIHRGCGCYDRPVRTYRVSEAARLLGVSDDTVRRWIDHGVLATTGDAPTAIAGDALARRAVEIAQAGGDPRDVLSSARNRFVGLVTRIQVDGVMAQVDIQSGPHRVVSLMSAEAVHELGLEVGALATAVVKATTVIVETPRS